MKNFSGLYLGFALMALLSSCNLYQDEIEVIDFKMFTNFDVPGDTLTLEMDLTNAPFGGIRIPSPFGKDGDKQFHFSFTARQSSRDSQPLAYKIYYQNESYKHPEVIMGRRKEYNPLSRDNFYGSWVSDSLVGFKTIPSVNTQGEIHVVDSVFIAGNPMNHERFYGSLFKPYQLSDPNVDRMMHRIRSDSTWFQLIQEKALTHGHTVEDQLRTDALWTLQNKHKQIHENQRWQNNPRVGSYRFMLVLGTAKALEQLPDNISNPEVLKKFESRVNPFYYFQYGEGSQMKALSVVTSDKVLKTYAVLRPESGVYYEPYNYSQAISPDRTENCKADSAAFHNALFRQYLNTVYKDHSLNNVISTADIGGTDYSRRDYEQSVLSTHRDSTSYVSIPTEPCLHASYDAQRDAIVLANPGNKAQPYIKQNAGTAVRVGFTYGKYRARIRFPEVLSTDHVWNGITCAYWLKMHSLEQWNIRDTCYNEGYRSKGVEDVVDGSMVPVSPYSEIDIEIVKVSRHWPKTSYTQPDTVNYYDPAEDRNLIVTCTNWDLSCRDPKNFDIGVQRIQHGNKIHHPHRWDTWYQALTLKTEKPHDETVGEILWYEIDWRPNEIIWRIGPNAQQMDEVGYMNDDITKIPNNQMAPVISQEFHYGDWWPTTPFHQSNIPYPTNPIEGLVYEIIIE